MSSTWLALLCVCDSWQLLVTTAGTIEDCPLRCCQTVRDSADSSDTSCAIVIDSILFAISVDQFSVHCMSYCAVHLLIFDRVPSWLVYQYYARSLVNVWYFAVVPSRRPSSCRRCSWATTVFHSEPNMRHALWCGHTAPSVIEHLQLRDPDYDQSSIAPERGGLIIQ